MRAVGKGCSCNLSEMPDFLLKKVLRIVTICSYVFLLFCVYAIKVNVTLEE